MPMMRRQRELDGAGEGEEEVCCSISGVSCGVCSSDAGVMSTVTGVGFSLSPMMVGR